jgi:hypothetical protein
MAASSSLEMDREQMRMRNIRTRINEISILVQYHLMCHVPDVRLVMSWLLGILFQSSTVEQIACPQITR